MHRFKFGGYWGLASTITGIMIDDARSLLTGHHDHDVVITGVPLHRVRLRERGYDQARMLAMAISEQLGIEHVDGALKRKRNTRPQAQLPLEERNRNVNGAFCVPDPAGIEDRTVLLIDDVATTGLTLSSCAHALAGAGARDVLALTFTRRLLSEPA